MERDLKNKQMKDKAYSTYADITPEVRKQWEAKYGKKRLHDIELETEDGSFRYILRKPGRNVMEAVAKAGDKDIALANKIFISNCVLGGDMEAIDLDGDVYLTVLGEIAGLTTQKKIKVKKH